VLNCTGAEPSASSRKPADPGERPGKAASTRALILQTALTSFRERGYDQTTMRGIAQQAGVSAGNAYYYFGSKEELVQEFYALIQDGHRRRAAPALRSAAFADRLRGVLRAGFDEMAPYHSFASSFIKVAIPPTSPCSPFSPESGAARDAAIGLFRETLEGSAVRIGGPLAEDLPQLLWLAYLAITLFWVYDTSPGQARTRALIDSASRLIARAVGLSRLPLLRGIADDVHGLLSDLRAPGAGR
jgi:AcrR family transcriptional regulator